MLIDLGQDSAGCPLQVILEFYPGRSGHQMFCLSSPPVAERGESAVSLIPETLGPHIMFVTVKHEDDGRTNAQVHRGPRQEHMGPDPEPPELGERDREIMREHAAHQWDGVTLALSLLRGWGEQRKEWSRVLQRGDWERALYLLRRGASPNDWQLSRPSRNSPLHWAAEGRAPVELVHAMIEHGGWRTLPNANGERPVDIAARKNYRHLVDVLSPVLRHTVNVADLATIQSHFHDMMRLLPEAELHELRKPELAPLLELEEPKMYFSVPGHYGGYQYWLDSQGAKPKLIVESRNRMSSGSVPRWEITTAGAVRVESVNTQ